MKWWMKLQNLLKIRKWTYHSEEVINVFGRWFEIRKYFCPKTKKFCMISTETTLDSWKRINELTFANNKLRYAKEEVELEDPREVMQ